MARLVDQLQERRVGELIAADHLRVVLRLVVSEQRHLDLGRILDDVVVGDDEAVLADDEAAALGVGHRLALAAASSALVVLARSGRCTEEAPEEIVGRAATCDVVINHPSVSRLHLKVTVRGDSCVLTDLGSARGTRRQDQLIAGEVELAGGAAAATRSTSSRSTRRLARGRSSL